MATVAKS